MIDIEKLLALLENGEIQESWDGWRFHLYARRIPTAFFEDYQRMTRLRAGGLLDSDDYAKTRQRLIEKYKGGE